MKEMIYDGKNAVTVLDDDVHRGYRYLILSYGRHPCAYVEIPPNSGFYGKHYDDMPEIACHGGLTYSDNRLYLENGQIIKGWFLGWDYAHSGDCSCVDGKVFGGKQWTTAEIKREAQEVIDQIIESDPSSWGWL
ncbi:MAG: hypothetical protein NC299_15295 [Lachnospiraceae bacterium]|nr:hypothetical protein [Lachnospiraceae bacterium]